MPRPEAQGTLTGGAGPGERLTSESDALRQESDPALLVGRLLGVWRAAADGPVSSEVLALLSSYTFDPDPAVARAAALAVADLEALALRRAEEDTEAARAEGPTAPTDAIGDAMSVEPSDQAEDAVEAGDAQRRREAGGLRHHLTQIRAAAPGARLAAVQGLWRYAGDIRSPELLDQACAELVLLVGAETDPAVIRVLHSAADDLQRLAEERAAGAASLQGPDSDWDPEGWMVEEDGLTSEDTERLARHAAVVESLVRRYEVEPNRQERPLLLGALGSHSPETALNLALQGLADPDVAVRHASVQLLWRKGADGHGQRAELLGGLEEATLDRDKRVREAALTALLDLETLDHPAQAPQDE